MPANAEPELAQLVESWLTPLEHFYIRSHGPVPEIDPREYRLSVEGLVEKPLKLSLEDLEGLAQTETTATLTCAGNRRSEHSRQRKVEGVPWGPGAIGNARWQGVRLSEVLKRAGLRDEARHVWFEGLDQVAHQGQTIAFGGSIPLAKAMGDSPMAPGALLATRMNGQPLPADHGFPARTVVPGYIGARSVKWLGRIVVSDHPSPNHYLQEAYKLVVEDGDLAWAEAAAIY
ncbi:MAG: molybdopterin-dependent oxidoreductase, partial [Planctomycetes bacterium]|nr:molybdopterin-dependent oxidoreductase [Planctomycetota bacterium]